jgi:uncharacterized protein YbcI
MKRASGRAIIVRRMTELVDAQRTGTDEGARVHGDAAAGGKLNAAITRAVVGIHREFVGRGPTKAQSFFRGNVVVVVLNEVMTAGERMLVAGRRRAVATSMRRELHETMRPDLARAVEELTGAAVEALVVDSDVDADTTVALFVLDRPVNGPRAAGGAEPGRPPRPPQKRDDSRPA